MQPISLTANLYFGYYYKDNRAFQTMAIHQFPKILYFWEPKDLKIILTSAELTSFTSLGLSSVSKRSIGTKQLTKGFLKDNY